MFRRPGDHVAQLHGRLGSPGKRTMGIYDRRNMTAGISDEIGGGLRGDGVLGLDRNSSNILSSLNAAFLCR